MRKQWLALLWLMLSYTALSASPICQGRNFGLGLVVGEPSGLSWKYWKGSGTAIDGTLAWSFLDDGYFRANVDYLWHDYEAITVEQGQMPLYYGVGAALWGGHFHDRDGANIGVRGVIGLEYIFRKAPFDIFLELAPTLDLAPATGLWLQGGLGVRYYF
jgi:hypothetical protein